MMKYGTRYDLEGEITVAPDRDGEDSVLTVLRVFPEYQSGRFGTYIWRDGDRIDKVASYFLNDPLRWWELLDLNPEIHLPSEISPGMGIRVPLDIVEKL